jgi:putative peptidoglycan binding protein
LGAFSPSIALATVPAPAVTTEAPSDWQTTVAIAAPAPTPAALPKTLSPTDPDARYKLVLDIQQQLRRAGCYWGRIDGSWGLATKDAVKEFTNRVNAALPLDEPDYVQLTLIQSHGEKTCGACPAGQSLSASGRCVGLPIRAEGKQSGAPQVANTVQTEVLPWKKADGEPDAAPPQPLFRPMPNTVVSTEPLPERMAIGGPGPTSVDVQQGAAPVPLAPATTAVLDPPVTAAPKSERRTRRVAPGTPRYNLLLSLGGLY